MKAFLYTLPNCDACEKALELVKMEADEIYIYDFSSDPLAALGLQHITGKKDVFAPVALIEGKGAFILDNSREKFLKLKVSL